MDDLIAALDGEQLMDDLDTLGRIGAAHDGGGLMRLAYLEADKAGRAWVREQLAALGVEIREDTAGNTIVSYAGTNPDLPPLAIGSHTDTVPNGGKYDGALGVLAALAIVRTLGQQDYQLRHPVEVINFAAEEATLPGATFGSRAMAGTLPAAVFDQAMADGVIVRDYLQAAGYTPEGILNARREPHSVTAFLELHIEQGARLSRSQTPIGVVTGIVSIRRYAVTVTGHANHAGTTQMVDRNDALVTAAGLVTTLRDIALKHNIVGTTGTLDVYPNAPNVIPGRVQMTMELRALDHAILDAAERDLYTAATNVGANITPVSNKASVHSDPRLLAALETACNDLSVDYTRLASGAGHDAMAMAALCPVAMVFVPSRDGISHDPAEYTSPEHCILGARVLLGALLRLDEIFD